MKKYLLFFSTLLFSATLFAQSPLVGTWSGRSLIDGQQMGFKLYMKKDGTFSMAYDLSPNDLSLKGSWAQKGDLLIFKSEGLTLQLKKVPKNSKVGKEVHVMEFKRDSKNPIVVGFENQAGWAFPEGQVGWSFFGWDKKMHSVVINHEEQY
ncbi:MAG: hypothetical protein KDC80_14285 [Saprospiraceae bacterium]|nr:hypothetical protein [Lewinella sp.]MCB0666997.1 hypothetical protein [Saprospiraceae bacterium]